jgi:hypothetical protein
LKADPQSSVKVIGPLFRRIMEECVFPEERGLSDVSPIPKEGRARDSVDTYRPIYLIHAMCKPFSLLLTSRITHHIETNKLLGEEHIGFRRNMQIHIFLYADDIALLADSAQQIQAMLFVCEKWVIECRMIFSLKKCEIVEYGAVLTDRVREWDLQGGKVLEGKVYKYLGILFTNILAVRRTQ